MTMRVLPPDVAIRLIGLAGNPYRPKEIVQLKEEIDGEIRATELAASISGSIDMNRIRKITEMRLQLDSLYADWAEGKLE